MYSCVWVCVSAIGQVVQKRALDLLELELLEAMSCLCGCWDPNSGPLEE